jgi:hypothetical protein
MLQSPCGSLDTLLSYGRNIPGSVRRVGFQSEFELDVFECLSYSLPLSAIGPLHFRDVVRDVQCSKTVGDTNVKLRFKSLSCQNSLNVFYPIHLNMEMS